MASFRMRGAVIPGLLAAQDSEGEDFSGTIVFLLKALLLAVGVVAALVTLSLVLMVPLLRSAVWLKEQFVLRRGHAVDDDAQ